MKDIPRPDVADYETYPLLEVEGFGPKECDLRMSIRCPIATLVPCPKLQVVHFFFPESALDFGGIFVPCQILLE
ncbi:hypothetical protein [Aestuariivirga litoralis]|uniref:hypothetical protein n=1 Tax=Aestuariivirga litoralis TaxID=2650924 RepID=UPI001FED78C5|nr:hypothetical protein [Aestuariivirga litoralis]